VASGLARLLPPGAALVCSVMTRCCAWEIGWGLVHLRPGEAFRRLRGDWVQAGLAAPEGRLTVPTRYYSPRSFAQALAPHFRLRSARGLPVLLPPPYLAHLVAGHPDAFGRLERLERRVRDHYPFHSLGDHALLVLERTESAAPAAGR
jgi:hypothetical protein